MRRHLAYFKYVIRHKWFVFRAGLKIGVPLWQLIIHDWSKFLPSEWVPYAYTFYDESGSSRENAGHVKHIDFDAAWNHHQKRNKHHWQYWLLFRDNGSNKCIPMPDRYLKEMVADWMGAGRAITGEWEVQSWYEDNSERIQLAPETREKVEELIYE